jgi:hypothetical protein
VDVNIVFSTLKIGVIILLSIYLVFAFVMVRQVRIMTETLELGYENSLRMLSYFHFLFAIGVLLYAIFIL